MRCYRSYFCPALSTQFLENAAEHKARCDRPGSIASETKISLSQRYVQIESHLALTVDRVSEPVISNCRSIQFEDCAVVSDKTLSKVRTISVAFAGRKKSKSVHHAPSKAAAVAPATRSLLFPVAADRDILLSVYCLAVPDTSPDGPSTDTVQAAPLFTVPMYVVDAFPSVV